MACDYPLRSVLYVPGDNARALEKARELPADALILDLEDGVGPAKKKEARANIRQFFEDGGGAGKYVTVRVNGLDGEWVGDDVAAFAGSGARAIVFPKIETPDDVTSAEVFLERGGYGEDTGLWCMIETPLGVLNAEAVAGGKGRLECLVMGTSDLVKDLHARHTPDRQPVLYALSHCLLAARAHDLSIVDGVHLDLGDQKAFEQSCRQGADMGFDGKTVIHPKQIEGANKAFSPSSEDIEAAGKIVAAFDAAAQAGKGVAVVDGKLVEALHAENAKRILALAEKIKR